MRPKVKATSKIVPPALKNISQVTAIKKNLVKVRDEIVGKSKRGPDSTLTSPKKTSTGVHKQRSPTKTQQGTQRTTNEKWMAMVSSEIKEASKGESGSTPLKSKASPNTSKRPVPKNGPQRPHENLKLRSVKKSGHPPTVERHGVPRTKKADISSSTQSKLSQRKPKVSAAFSAEGPELSSGDERVSHPNQQMKKHRRKNSNGSLPPLSAEGPGLSSGDEMVSYPNQQMKKHRRKKSNSSAGAATPGGTEGMIQRTRKPRQASDNPTVSDTLPRKASSNTSTSLSANVPVRRPGAKPPGTRLVKSAAMKGSPGLRRESDAVPVSRTKKLVHRRESAPSSNVKQVLVDGHHGHLAQTK
jgi:hypothetical protein